MSTPQLWEQVRAACELLHEMATVQAQRGLHPDAGAACRWLDHIGGVAAYEAAAAAAPADTPVHAFVGSGLGLQ